MIGFGRRLRANYARSHVFPSQPDRVQTRKNPLLRHRCLLSAVWALPADYQATNWSVLGKGTTLWVQLPGFLGFKSPIWDSSHEMVCPGGDLNPRRYLERVTCLTGLHHRGRVKASTHGVKVILQKTRKTCYNRNPRPSRQHPRTSLSHQQTLGIPRRRTDGLP